MPIEFSTSLELDLVYARWWGHMTAETRRENFINYLRDRYYRPGRTEFIDLSGVLGSDFDFDRAQMLIRQIRQQGPPDDVSTRRVLWAPGDVPFGCARIFQSVAEVLHNGNVEVYRREFRALQALNLTYDRVADLRADPSFRPQAKQPALP